MSRKIDDSTRCTHITAAGRSTSDQDVDPERVRESKGATDDRCSFTTKNGRRCRMPRVNSHVTLCGTHLEAQQRTFRLDPSVPLQDVLSGITDLRSATAVNHLLANLTALLTDGRIDYRKALILGYYSQLLLQTINMANNERWDEEEPAKQPPPIPLPPASLTGQ